MNTNVLVTFLLFNSKTLNEFNAQPCHRSVEINYSGSISVNLHQRVLGVKPVACKLSENCDSTIFHADHHQGFSTGFKFVSTVLIDS